MKFRLPILFLCYAIGLLCAKTSLAQEVSKPIGQDALQQIAETEDLEYGRMQKLIKNWAMKWNLPTSYRDSTGTYHQIYRIDEKGNPVWRQSTNAGAAITTRAVDLQEGGRIGANLSGKSLKLGIWDVGSVRATHQEFGNRVIQKDVPYNINDNHSTHVAGTMVAKGIDVGAKGMAGGAILLAHDFNNDNTEMARRAREGLILSNHSYATICGWSIGTNGYEWTGDTTVSDTLDYKFGFYSSSTRVWDAIAENAPYYLIVKAVGNNRNVLGPAGGSRYKITSVSPARFSTRNRQQATPFYDCIPTDGTGKNTLTVGAVSPVASYTGPASVNITPVSSIGPTDDGRIKPDLVAKGQAMYSTGSASDNTYYYSGGTSMAAPNVTGSLALVQEFNQKVRGNYLKSSTLKGLAIHTAKECGPAEGPDYMYGWGLLDAGAMADVIIGNKFNHGLVEKTLENGVVFDSVINVATDATTLKATICWTDPAGSVSNPIINDRTPKLINDLDLRLISPSGVVYFPYTLNPNSPSADAQKADNIVDNVEKVFLAAVTEAGNWHLRVSHKGTLQNGQQNFGLSISGTNIGLGNKVVFTNPTGAVKIDLGIQRAIHFQKTFNAPVTLELWRNGVFYSSLESNIQGPLYQWTPNESLDTTGVYKLKVKLFGTDTVFAFSGDIKFKGSQLRLFSFYPREARTGNTIVINGTGFRRTSEVKLGTTPLAFTIIADTAISLRLPYEARTGYLKVTNDLGISDSSREVLTVMPLSFLCDPYAVQRGRLEATDQWQSQIFQANSTHCFTVKTNINTIYQFETCDNNGQNTLIRLFDSTTNSLAYVANDNGPLCTGIAASFSWPAIRNTIYYVLITDSTCNPITRNINFRYRISDGTVPTFTGSTPNIGYPGTRVRISGTNLREINAVSVGSQICPIVYRGDTLLIVTIPEGAMSGDITISGGTATFNAGRFEVLFQPFRCGARSINNGFLPLFTSDWRSIVKPNVRGTQQYYKFNAAFGAFYSFSTCDMDGYDTEIRIYKERDSLLIGYQDDNGPICQTRSSSINFRAPDDGTYIVLFNQWSCAPFETDTLSFSFKTNFVLIPTINGVDPVFATVGDTIKVIGDNLFEYDTLLFSGIPVQRSISSTPTQIKFQVPANAENSQVFFIRPDQTIVSGETVIVCYSNAPTINRTGIVNLCEGQTLRLSARALGFHQFQWNNNQVYDTLYVTQAGDYSVRGINAPCTSQFSPITRVQIVSNPTVSIAYNSPSIIATTNRTGTYQWYADSIPLVSEIRNTFNPTVNGIYSVTFTDTNGCQVSDTLSVVVSVSKKLNSSFKLYPNPSAGNVSITLPSSLLDGKVIIQDVLGKKVLTASVSNNSVLNLEALAAGTYRVILMDGKSYSGSQLLVIRKTGK